MIRTGANDRDGVPDGSPHMRRCGDEWRGAPASTARQVCPAKAAAETTGEVIGKLRDLRMTVRGPRLADLLALCDAPPNLSVGCRHHGIDVARGLNTATTSS